MVMSACALAALAGNGCKQRSAEERAVEWSLTCDAFGDGERMPARHTCDGDNLSPPLAWETPPEGAKELALICDDPDAPRGTFSHWVIYGMPPALTSLPAAVPAMEHPPGVGGAKQGRNDFGAIGYRGPCPPGGKPHHYHFRLYALDAATDLEPGATRGDLLQAMGRHIIAQAEVVGVYEK
jgi:Raf kinase inhibitor-like YbhB/YbcL family protein